MGMIIDNRKNKAWVVMLMIGMMGVSLLANVDGVAVARQSHNTRSGDSSVSKRTSTRRSSSIATLEGVACAPAIKTKEGQGIPTEVWGTGVERVKAATKVYGLLAMQMQRTYGVPWEVLIAQMQIESQIGRTGAARNGSNNWLGITGKGDAGKSGRYARFSSVEESIKAWTGAKVMRNGAYNEAMWHTDPNKWNLRDFLANMVHVYAPASDGNDEAGYVRDVMNIINKMVKPAREEMGWPSSEELAKSEKIAVGGIYPIGSKVGSELVPVCQ